MTDVCYTTVAIIESRSRFLTNTFQGQQRPFFSCRKVRKGFVPWYDAWLLEGSSPKNPSIKNSFGKIYYILAQLPVEKRSLCTQFWNLISLGDHKFMSIRLYVGNLPKEEIDRDALAAMFADEGDQVSTKVIKDRKTGKCRGFAFVTVPSDEVADQFIEKYNGQPFMESPIKIEKALPRSKGEEGEAATEGNSAPKKKSPSPSPSSGSKRSGKKPASTQKQQGSIQPDPRWADELAKLKEMLASANN